MPRKFNTAGPCNPADHYMLPATTRLPDVVRLIDDKSYFVLHAPRQSGKTTAMQALARDLTVGGQYVAVLLSMEVDAPFEDDLGAAETALLKAWRAAVERTLPADLVPPPWPAAPPGARLSAALHAWARFSSRPVVLFLDEIDALRNAVLTSILRQLRAGFPHRPEAFPTAMGLIGRRGVRDYPIDHERTGLPSAISYFNIVAESLTLRDFSADEIAALYQQHSADTGQVFMADAIHRTAELTRGQPRLVNSLARQVVEVVVPDPAMRVTAGHIEIAHARVSAGSDALCA